jgi:pSer/pThr/pTyr-binding forkhead associated (FHA) protein
MHRIRSSVVAGVSPVSSAPAAPRQRQRTDRPERAETQIVSRATSWLEVHGERHPLTRAITVVGRGTDVDLRIDDPGVSRRHAEIHSGDSVLIADLHSTNGTVVDGHQIKQAELHDGARIVMGSTTLVFRRSAR